MLLEFAHRSNHQQEEPMRPSSKWILAILACVAMNAHAQEWPGKPIRFIVPFPPGGSVDQVARILGNALAPALGQPIVVDSRGGAAGSIGTGIAAKAPPDGYTFVVVFDTHAVNPSLIPNLAFDTAKDLAPVMLIATSPMALVTHQATPYKSMADVVAAAKAKPATIGFGSIGSGSLGHLAMTLLQSQGGFQLTHVPYKGGGPLMQDAIAGHVPLAIGTTFLVSPHIESKLVRPLAVTSAKRHPQMPGVPTMAEDGFPGFEAYAWWGILAPANTPKPIIERMHAELVKALNQSAVRDKLTQQGMDIVAGTPEGFGQFVAAEIERWGRIVRDNKIKAGE
jgi:tripartite-type tricarboxylate transporter receptor subunit TctC